MREITEGLKPIKECIENLPQAIQPLGEASGEVPENLGEIAYEYLNTPPLTRDTTFRISEEKGLYNIGIKQATIADNNIIVGNEKFKGPPGLWEFIMTQNPKHFNDEDCDNYARLMLKTNALELEKDPSRPKSSRVRNGIYLGVFGIIGKSIRERGFRLFCAILTR